VRRRAEGHFDPGETTTSGWSSRISSAAIDREAGDGAAVAEEAMKATLA